MSSRGQPTPPFNSPYQQAMRPTSLLHSPAYPSPARSDSEPSRFAPEGLGLYNFSPGFSSSSMQQPTSNLFPPSPHPSEAWSASPLPSEPIVDPWLSGAYDHPVSRSSPWSPQYDESHRSSLSSHREMSVFSGDGSENSFAQVKLETGAAWTTENNTSPPGTVAPERLLNASLFSPHDQQPYGSQMLPKYENTPGPSHDGHVHMSSHGRLGSSHSNTQNGATPRVRRRRTKTAPENAKYSCELCGRGFVRSYNKKSHMDRHKPNREKLYRCDHGACSMKFDRKTDLDRHTKSVHDKIRDFGCFRCGDTFSRKDTLRRHEEDGCQQKNQLSPSQLTRGRYMRASSDALYPSPRPDMYATVGFHSTEATQGVFGSRANYHPDEGSFASRSPSLFRTSNFGASPHF
ncbi:hypothetical protein P280DRAFT_465233 [Massarina eburnea CBS 473.64]|uniref:C2H2-type domain-containing protein n=1 Tax=Massarina eburnea CBS 473.64 TaxID=1395130 RepID=A0A6A6SG24_9PLEO|nr:hypothetical protein P280DRAFT_465233 [Massarina eburnea CBS 473.64]